MEKENIIKFAQTLVRTPSPVSIGPETVLITARAYTKSINFPLGILKQNEKPIALVKMIEGAYPGKTWCLNACIDTAPIGDRTLWDKDPFSGDIENNILYGRGAADSKIAVSMFTHLAKELETYKARMHGNLMLIFDADEHTGNFGGIKTAIKEGYRPDGILIGYPGDDEFIIGARGFSRYKITTHGIMEHSGKTNAATDNPIIRIADITLKLTKNPPVNKYSDNFPKPPKCSVTETRGGEGFAIISGSAHILVDVRITPDFNEKAADQHIYQIVRQSDMDFDVPSNRKTTIEKISAEPFFVLPKTSELRQTMGAAIQKHSDIKVTEKICAPANIGCYLERLGIEAIAGYGLSYKNDHRPNEQVNLQDLDKAYNVYREACMSLLKIK